MCCEGGTVLGVLALCGHDVVTPAIHAAADAVPPQRGVAHHRPGVILKGLISTYTGLGQKVVPTLRECCRQRQAEVVSKSSNKFHPTWKQPFCRAL